MKLFEITNLNKLGLGSELKNPYKFNLV